MGLFSKNNNQPEDSPGVPQPIGSEMLPPQPMLPDLSSFSVARKGYDQEEVAQYVAHLLHQHQQDISAVQRRLIEAQQQSREEQAKAERQVSKIGEELSQVRADLEAAGHFRGEVGQPPDRVQRPG